MLRRLVVRVLRSVGLIAKPGPPDPLTSIGEHTYGNPKAQRYAGDTQPVTIGRYCSFARGVLIYPGGGHRTEWVTTYPIRHVFGLPGAEHDGHPTSRGPIVIGNDVWVGVDAMILSGVTIGDGAVVGAGAVVGRDVRPYAVVVGNPAREVRRRFTDEQIDALLDIRWWEWPKERVIAEVDDLCSANIDSFIKRFRPSGTS